MFIIVSSPLFLHTNASLAHHYFLPHLPCLLLFLLLGGEFRCFSKKIVFYSTSKYEKEKVSGMFL